jgi:leader peptidase (prepilin peptidase)/N-methyltransferase
MLAAGMFGLVVGSFLNVCIYRLPRGESIVAPRSRCPACGDPIRALDNIPVLSYLLLRGKCRNCGARISVQYPAVEALTAALFVAAVATFGPTLRGILAALFLCGLVVAALVDLEHQIIPHAVTLPGIPLGLLGAFLGSPTVIDMMQRFMDIRPGILAAFLSGSPPLPDAIIGCLAGAGFVYLTALYCEVILGREAMGLGDVNLVAMMGAFLGWRALVVAFFIATVGGSVVSLTLIGLRRRDRREPIPFGPFLALGAALALFWADPVLRWYGGLIGARG